MVKLILLPTDGSALSREAVRAGVEFAKNIGARVLGCHVIALPGPDRLEEWLFHDPQFAQRRQTLFEKTADAYLDEVARCAAAQGVPCECRKIVGHETFRELLTMAEGAGCDLICMASHGWKGGDEAWPGSVTLAVLRHSRVPVLVYKSGAGRTAGAAQAAPADTG